MSSHFCDYTGAKYAVAVDNQSNAIGLFDVPQNKWHGNIYARKNVSWKYSLTRILLAEDEVKFEKVERTTLKGDINKKPLNVWDSA